MSYGRRTWQYRRFSDFLFLFFRGIWDFLFLFFRGFWIKSSSFFHHVRDNPSVPHLSSEEQISGAFCYAGTSAFQLNNNKNHLKSRQTGSSRLSSITWSESYRMSCYCFRYHSKIIVVQSSRLCQRVDSSIFIVTRNTNPVGLVRICAFTDTCGGGDKDTHQWPWPTVSPVDLIGNIPLKVLCPF